MSQESNSNPFTPGTLMHMVRVIVDRLPDLMETLASIDRRLTQIEKQTASKKAGGR